jgi:hypothetical protein
MLEEPPFDYPLEEGKSCVCLQNGQYRAYLDRNAALELLFGLHWLAKDQPIGEEVDIWSRDCGELPCKGKPIGLCELHFVEAHTHKKLGKTILKQAQTIRHKPEGHYTEAHNRLDYYVSLEEVRAAYDALIELLNIEEDRRSVREVILFGTLIVRLVVL